MADQIAYDYVSLQQGIDDIKRIVSNIDSEIENLGSQARQVMQNWTAAGSQAYQADLKTITTDLDNIDQSLNQLALSIGDSADTFQKADNQIAQSFGT